jgi:CRP/FNR family cyclic AMP-dependent transcriptional regulator
VKTFDSGKGRCYPLPQTNNQIREFTAMLEQIAIFTDLEKTELEALEKQAVTRTFPKNSVIINEGDASDALFVVNTGRVKVFLSDEEGKEIVLNTHGPGEYFGEIAMLDEAPRSASVITLEKSSINIISKADFEDCLCRHPRMALSVIRGLAARLRKSTENVRSLALLDVYGRVARLLLELAEDDNGRLTIRDKLTHQDIADRVGSSREMISRILKDLKLGGYIEIEDRHITIAEKLPHAW